MSLDDGLAYCTTLLGSKADLASDMREIAKWAPRRKDYRRSSVWSELAEIDWGADAARVRGWFLGGIRALASKKEVELVVVDLGDCPEIFNMRGCKAAEDATIPVAPGTFLDIEAVQWGNGTDLCYERTDSLPGEIWKVFPRCEALPRRDMVSGYALWFGFASQVAAEALTSGEINFVRVLGKRTEVPLFMGFESLFVSLGSLTPRGWKLKAK